MTALRAVTPMRVEWNAVGDMWTAGTVLEVRLADSAEFDEFRILLDETGQQLEVQRRHIRTLREGDPHPEDRTAAEELAELRGQVDRALAVIRHMLGACATPPTYVSVNNMAVVELLLTDPSKRVYGVAGAE